MRNKHESDLGEKLRNAIGQLERRLPPPDFNRSYEHIDSVKAPHRLNRIFVRRTLLAAAALVCVIGVVSVPIASRERSYRAAVSSFVENLYADPTPDIALSDENPFNYLFDTWNLLSIEPD